MMAKTAVGSSGTEPVCAVGTQGPVDGNSYRLVGNIRRI